MNHSIETIAALCKGEARLAFPAAVVRSVMIDSREAIQGGAMFAAIGGVKTDGHAFVPALMSQGVRHFLVSNSAVAQAHEGKANFIVVKDVVRALQQIAAHHRDRFTGLVIGIAGSNGKTIVKEWLNTLLESRHTVCRSPKSFNSQLGVALSVLRLEDHHTIALFEAGISQPNEMERLEKIIRPQMGVFTNLGDAHAAHFVSEKQKLEEKFRLFARAETIVCCADQPWFAHLPKELKAHMASWSATSAEAQIAVTTHRTSDHTTIIEAHKNGHTYTANIPFTDRVSVENATHCLCALIEMGMADQATLERFALLTPVAMRMEVKQGIEGSVLIDDSYNSDLESLRAALVQLKAQEGRTPMVILTDMDTPSDLNARNMQIGKMLIDAGVTELVTIGPELQKHRNHFSAMAVSHFPDADAYWQHLDVKTLRGKAILIKGARKFKLEQLVKRLQAQQHETTLEIDLQKLGENLRYFRSQIEVGVKTMVMVKAFGYGSGGVEVATYLQNQKVDYLAVAYADEGVELRKKGIHTPIMVMSPTESAFESIIKNNLEPEIYSLRSLSGFIAAASPLRHLFDTLNIHLKVDSGMHRLGFGADDLEEALRVIRACPFVRAASVFTHLSAADEPSEDAFTAQQVETFSRMAAQTETALGYKPMRHVLNSTGILRFPNYQFDMVRIGIGLYGFAATGQGRFLNALGRLKTYIVQIREVATGESVGYGRAGKHSKKRRIATVAIGYADGLDRRLGEGVWSLTWQGHPCPIVGRVCMDMCMIDVSGCDAREGDEVVVFEGAGDIERMADLLGTISYEVLTKISQRVRRVYLQE